MRPYLLVAGDFVRTGGMDAANHALAAYLARTGAPTHLAAHRVAPELAAAPGVRWHRVPRPLGSHRLGFPLLDRAGRRVAAALAPHGGRVVVNGGNCRARGAVWLHYVHAAHRPLLPPGRPLARAAAALAHRGARRDERRAVARAPVVIANSQRTAEDARSRLGAAEERVRVVYYGVDADRFRPPAAGERVAARAALGWESGRPVAAFVGALGDRRKGFDTLYRAWASVDADLAVVGAGSEAAAWRARAERDGLGARIRFLGFRDDVRAVLWASDAIVAPTRYEAYGLAVHEALCCGLPAVVSADAGVAERIGGPLRALLLDDVEDADALAGALRRWRADVDGWRGHAGDLAGTLRRRSWDDMAREIVDAIEAVYP